MDSISNEKLVEIITREVMNILGSKQEGTDRITSKPGLLVMGSADRLPADFLNGFNIYGVDDYALHGDIDQYCGVIMTEITLTQLSDIALGRDERPYQCAVIKALLSNKKVYLLAEALTYHRYAKTANKAYYNLLVDYEKKMTGFGIRIISATKLSNSVIVDQTEQDSKHKVFDCTEKVITGKKAEELCFKLRGTVNLRKGTIITPLAKDAFGAAKININFV